MALRKRTRAGRSGVRPATVGTGAVKHLQGRAIVRRTTTAQPPSAGPRGADASDLFRLVIEMGSSLLAAAGWMVEKELSIGAEIAKFVEGRFPKVDVLKSGMPANPIRGVSLDAGKFSDLAGDAIRIMATLLAGRLGGIVSFAVKPPVRRIQSGAEALAVLQIPGPLSPGQTGERVLLLGNESSSPTRKFTLASSDLLCASGRRIAANCVRFEPVTLSVAAHGKGRVVVGVTVPKNTPSGSYTGLLRGAGLEHQGSLLRVDVA